MRTCGACGEVFDEDAEFCAYDGQKLDDWCPEAETIDGEPSAFDRRLESLPTRQQLHPLATTATLPPARVGMPMTPPLATAPTDPSPGSAAAALPMLGIDEPTPGVLLGDRYLLQQRLAVGGFGAVFAAEDRRLRKRVAVKVLSPRLGTDREMLGRFQREAIAASQIGHDSIVNVTDLGKDKSGLDFIVMELLTGRDLAQALRDEGPLDLSRALSLSLAIADALGAAHARGIVHRDLKPANVFLSRTNTAHERVKIIDFGISKMIETPTGLTPQRLTNTGQVLGTPYYLAPEQATVDRQVDARTDIYALGVMLYEMLVGRPPFVGTTLAVLASHLGETPVPPSRLASKRHLDQDVDRLVMRALEKDPARRYGSMAEFAEALRALMPPGRSAVARAAPSPREATSAGPATGDASVTHTRPSRLLEITLIVAIASVLALALAIWFVRG